MRIAIPPTTQHATTSAKRRVRPTWCVLGTQATRAAILPHILAETSQASLPVFPLLRFANGTPIAVPATAAARRAQAIWCRVIKMTTV